AERYPEAWEFLYDDKYAAQRGSAKLKEEKQKGLGALQLSIELSRAQNKSIGQKDVLLQLVEAEFVHVTVKSTDRISTKYTLALLDADELTHEVVMRELQLFQKREILHENTIAALESVERLIKKEKITEYYLLFTGHMIDKKDREKPRFPTGKEKTVTQAIREKILAVQKNLGENKKLIGITGGACGGDIIFHEQCQELGIESRMFLAVPAPLFKIKSVA